MYSMASGRAQRTNKRFIFQHNTDEIPQYLLRATVYPFEPTRVILSNYGWDAVPPVPPNPLSLTDAVNQLPADS
jgi:hypothetical protein